MVGNFVGKGGLAILAMAMAGVATPGTAASLVLQNSYNLAPALGSANFNFNPQGMGYDAAANELLFIQQNTNTIYRTDLTGTIVGSRTIGAINVRPDLTTSTANFTVSVAADASNYYFSDYTNNSNGKDLYSLGKATGAATVFSTETAAFGGYPIDVEGGFLYRTEASTTYNYSNLDQIRISALSAPDTIITTLSLAGTSGIADFSVDVASGSIFTLQYLQTANILRYDLSTGALIETFSQTFDGLTAGMTFAGGKLYVYDWQTGASTLRVFAVDGLPSVSAAVPEPSTWASLVIGFGVVGGVARAARRRKTLALARG